MENTTIWFISIGCGIITFYVIMTIAEFIREVWIFCRKSNLLHHSVTEERRFERRITPIVVMLTLLISIKLFIFLHK